ncbi:unnamed protein product [Bursaphelenchus okinawaensis]|uniref:Major facilitator superfamily (MFS) profile domain-containing protein n=1 Tax=Bursaphelenchus okinawaensis TaxID=465554 RepID=A0A811LQJ9_9BILA|nr:unnamed protein product [Bursaphelenchus okinawaensis]CAG9127329.1 unnamed protein product [Bursaphelenchus okinawaensis]
MTNKNSIEIDRKIINDVVEPSEDVFKLQKGIADVNNSEVEANSSLIVEETPWWSIYITALLGFCQAVQYTLYFTSTWPYLQVIDRESTEQFYGAVVASYSIGQIMSAPLFGYWSNRSKSVKGPLIVCLILSMFGNLTYALAETIPYNARYFLFGSRFIVGCGSSYVSVLKSYVAMASTQLDRSRAVIILTSGLSFGHLGGPVIQMIFTIFGYPGTSILGRMHFNMYTSAAYFAIAMNVIAMTVLLKLFDEKYAGIHKSVLEKKSKEDKEANPNKLPPYDMTAVVLCHLTVFASAFTFYNLETLNSPIGITIFGWTKKLSVQMLGIVHACTTGVSTTLYLVLYFFKLDKHMNLRRQIVLAFCGFLIFHLITFAWPFLGGHLETYTQAEYDAALNNGTEITGCNTDRFDWCYDTPSQNVYVFYVSFVVFVGFCIPNLNITVNTLFSKILGPRRIGTQQGILQVVTSLARLSGPIVASQFFPLYGSRVPWIMALRNSIETDRKGTKETEKKQAEDDLFTTSKDISDSTSSSSATTIATEDSVIVAKTPWKSIYITAGLGFCQAVQFTLYFSSTWPYLQTVDRKSTEQFYGTVIAAYSIGQIMSAPFFGYWSNRARSVKGPLTASLILSMIGNFSYALAETIPHNARFFVLGARFIVGCGSGYVSVLKSYVAMASTQSDRSRAFAILTGGLSLGQTTGPVIQLIFTIVGYPGLHMIGRMQFNMYTAAAYSAIVMNLIAMMVLLNLFEEKYAGIDKSILEKKSKEEKEANPNKLPPYDIIAVVVCYCTTFAQRFTFVNLETMNPPIGMSIFGWTRKTTVQLLGMVHACTTGVSFLLYLVFLVFKLDKYMNLRRQIVLAFCGLLLFHLVTYAWPFLGGNLETYTQAEYDAALNNGTEITGCNTDRFDWCYDTPSQNVYVFYVSFVVFVGFCIPNLNITVNTLFSKILGPRRIGTQQGILQMSGSVARLIGPILASQFFTLYGPQIPWIMGMVVLGSVIATWLILHKRMVPLHIPSNDPTTASQDNKEKKNEKEEKIEKQRF